MTRPRLLDLFCKAGGATRGYQEAGFHVTGVDHEPQPNYCGDEFILADALEVPLGGYDVIHASPPCQHFTAYGRRSGVEREKHPNLIPVTRERLRAADVPYVIENVEQAQHHLRRPVRLCGTAFGPDLQRHRLFESNVTLIGSDCAHWLNQPRWPQATNRKNPRRTIEVGVYRIQLVDQQRAMGIDWMTLQELSQAIPPAYAVFVGEQLLRHLGAAA